MTVRMPAVTAGAADARKRCASPKARLSERPSRSLCGAAAALSPEPAASVVPCRLNLPCPARSPTAHFAWPWDAKRALQGSTARVRPFAGRTAGPAGRIGLLPALWPTEGFSAGPGREGHGRPETPLQTSICGLEGECGRSSLPEGLVPSRRPKAGPGSGSLPAKAPQRAVLPKASERPQGLGQHRPGPECRAPASHPCRKTSRPEGGGSIPGNTSQSMRRRRPGRGGGPVGRLVQPGGRPVFGAVRRPTFHMFCWQAEGRSQLVQDRPGKTCSRAAPVLFRQSESSGATPRTEAEAGSRSLRPAEAVLAASLFSILCKLAVLAGFNLFMYLVQHSFPVGSGGRVDPRSACSAVEELLVQVLRQDLFEQLARVSGRPRKGRLRVSCSADRHCAPKLVQDPSAPSFRTAVLLSAPAQ